MSNEKVWAIVVGIAVSLGIVTTYLNNVAEINANQAVATECVKNHMSWVPVPSNTNKYQCVPNRAE